MDGDTLMVTEDADQEDQPLIYQPPSHAVNASIIGGRDERYFNDEEESEEGSTFVENLLEASEEEGKW